MTKLLVSDDFTPPNEVRRSAFLMLGCVLTLLIFGSVMVYSASGTVRAEKAYARAESREQAVPTTQEMEAVAFRSFRSHLLKVGIGLVVLIAGASIDYRRWAKHSKWIFAITLVLLALVLVPGIGAKINGARRWFRSDLLPFDVQPSEIAKLALVVFLAAYVSRRPDFGQRFKSGFLPGALAVVAPAFLILIETDVGTFLLVAMLGFTLLLLAGAQIRHMVLLVVGVVPAIVYFAFERLAYVQARFGGFQDPEPTSQLGFALSALQVGGLQGMGLGGGRTKLFYLAEAENDFILSVIGEELGFLGTTAVVGLFALLLWSGVRVLLGIRNRFGFFLVAGVLLIITTQALINMAVATGSVPVKGMPLPFVSAGGSSLVVLCLAVGMVLNVARHPDRPSFVWGGDTEDSSAMGEQHANVEKP